MKKTIRLLMVIILGVFLICHVFPLLQGSEVLADVYDHFDSGSIPDFGGKWMMKVADPSISGSYDPYGWYTQTGTSPGYLNFTTDTTHVTLGTNPMGEPQYFGPSGIRLVSNVNYTGDFIVTMAFSGGNAESNRNYSIPVPPGGPFPGPVSLGVFISYGPGHGEGIYRGYGRPLGCGWFTWSSKGPDESDYFPKPPPLPGQPGALSDEGMLRLVREGSTIEAWYKDGSNDWTLFHTYTDTNYSGSVRFGISGGGGSPYGTYTVNSDWIDLSVTAPVPEPSTLLLLGSGLIGLAGYGRKKFFKM